MTPFLRPLLLALLTAAIGIPQQDPADAPPQKAAVATDIFSGSVTEMNQDSITVVRRVPAKKDVVRKFIRDTQTKLEGPLKLNARVTVRYRQNDEGQFLALHIIVR